MRRVVQIGLKRKPKSMEQEDAFTGNLNTHIEMIQALISIGLMAVGDQIEKEVVRLTDKKFSRQVGLPGHFFGHSVLLGRRRHDWRDSRYVPAYFDRTMKGSKKRYDVPFLI